MKRILYFDAAAGVSGDMFVGALLDLGASLEQVRADVAALRVDGMELVARKVTSRGIAATKFDVLDPVSRRPVDEPAHDHGHDHGHGHGSGHGHVHGHAQPHRGLREIRLLVRAANLPTAVADDALGVFEALATAEGRVHGVDPEEVHFHEVGALDSIADVVAACSAFHQLGVDEAWCSPVHVGSGTVRCAHGVLPVPAPATLELLKGIPSYSDGTRGELATPTGVALLRHLCTGFSPMPPLVVEAVGYGAGSKDFGVPSVFRATLATSVARATPGTAARAGADGRNGVIHP